MGTLLITCGQLFDATGRDAKASRTVVIEGDRIREVIATADLPRRPDLAGAEVVDAKSRFVMPGLINVHDHLVFRGTRGPVYPELAAGRDKLALNCARAAVTALRAGWTTIRDMGASYDLSFRFREFIARDFLPGPRMVVCGAPLCVTGGHAAVISVEADGVDAMRKAARRQLEGGADLVKVMASHDPVVIDGPQKTRPEMELDEIRAAFDQAKAHGKNTACHVMGTVAIDRVLDAGVDVVSHGFYLGLEQAQRMAETGVFLDPTLSSYGRQTINPALDRGQAWIDLHMPLIAPMEQAFRNAVKAGVRIVTGTDSAGRYAEDVEMMRELGLDAGETLLACTRNAAEALAVSHLVGTVEPGKVADLVILDGDPLRDPYALERVDMVVQGGRALRPDDIRI
ncbi:MAG: amidohydrolase family protein [Rhodobacteraceae bacterium]|jgi:imidazolonepropionase-like amidohydrolase|nr:amidohydrolase family protein [Paracoccaceae bacterium]